MSKIETLAPGLYRVVGSYYTATVNKTPEGWTGTLRYTEGNTKMVKIIPPLGTKKAMVAAVEKLASEITITVENMMTGKPVEIRLDTPYTCSPASETYWSM